MASRSVRERRTPLRAHISHGSPIGVANPHSQVWPSTLPNGSEAVSCFGDGNTAFAVGDSIAETGEGSGITAIGINGDKATAVGGDGTAIVIHDSLAIASQGSNNTVTAIDCSTAVAFQGDNNTLTAVHESRALAIGVMISLCSK